MNTFDGNEFSKKLIHSLTDKVNQLKKSGHEPVLASLYVATDAGSVLYTKLKKEKAESIGIKFIANEINANDVESVISRINELNNDSTITGILVQKPSGENQFSKDEWTRIVSTINPAKDVDGLTPQNLGLLSIGTPRFIPATVKAVIAVLDSWNISLEGKNVVIIGASEILGKPLAMILTEKNATVSLLHSKTINIINYTKSADILISATGVPGLITPNLVKEGVVLIDVGAPSGDVTKEAYAKASFVSPVPGGVGPVTIACLLENLVNVNLNS